MNEKDATSIPYEIDARPEVAGGRGTLKRAGKKIAIKLEYWNANLG